ncbi:MAG: hypothetical protein JNM30_01225 [Rhodospirillales bacterium]|nr:hypothetical protein [Rhodospirillales bacterium]
MTARRIALVVAAALAAIAAPEAQAQYGTPTCQQPGGQQLPGCGGTYQPSPQGEVFRGAARGAARGAVIGSISGNAGRGAAIGAATGGVFAAGRRAAYR